MASDARIVLVRPGDVLMLGNVTVPEDDEARDAFHAALAALKEKLGLVEICVFADDVDLAVKPDRAPRPVDFARGAIMPCGQASEDVPRSVPE